jgi:biotin carboxylase
MALDAGKSARQPLPKRVLLLLTARTYRAQAFVDAAQRIGVEVVKAYDMHPRLAEHYGYRLGLDYSQPEVSAMAIADFARERPLGAVISVDDEGTLVAAGASALLGLPHNDPAAAVAARDKHVMRQMLARGQVQAPGSTRYFLTAGGGPNELQEIAAAVDYPCVLKPLDLNGSRGVIRANDPKEFVMAAARLRRLLEGMAPSSGSWPFLVEEYVPGFEVALEGIMNDGQLETLALFDKPDPLEGPFFEETIYLTPSRLASGTQRSIERTVAEAAEALGLRQGAVHAELRLNECGPWLIEMAGRSIGGLCGQTLRFGVDISLEEMILRQALGMPFRNFKRETGARGVMMIPIPEAGLLKRVEGCEAAEAVPLVERVEITARLNYSLTPLPEGDSYLGFIFARGPSPQEVEDALRVAHSRLKFDIMSEFRLVPGSAAGRGAGIGRTGQSRV